MKKSCLFLIGILFTLGVQGADFNLSRSSYVSAASFGYSRIDYIGSVAVIQKPYCCSKFRKN